jgi:class 3 adenylate cyclase/tetratricopeptide (TPR) repeat protein
VDHSGAVTCQSCGQESPEGFRFCPHCGAALGVAAPPRTERKVVTVLFCDLVGFTARSDRADPEDVRAILQPFHALARAEIERHGGTLDKFIGDAAMGVFGSPVAHEDDPERAVRAALRILEGVRELNERTPGEPIAVRVGVNTGQAVVALSGGVTEGETVTGDVVNTASRLETAAPAGSVLVGEATHAATRGAVEYEELPPVTAKGKVEPLLVWRALAIRSVPATLGRPSATPFVGRELERALLEQAFLRAVRNRMLQLVTIVGEPGAGKSRLAAELQASIPRLAPGEAVLWSRGRCLPYGEGITFWALGEIVKGQAGILESDRTEERNGKLSVVLDELESDPAQRAWLRARLAPLVGGETGAPVERDEAFTAWLRFLEIAARSSPMVAVFEDLHWADPALLAFIEHLAEHATASPMLVIATARPELYDGHPSWGAGMRNAATVSIPPLTAEETATLVSSLLGTGLLTPEARELLLERSGGNPLYAEELARTLRERGAVDEHGLLLGDLPELGLPDTIQALIAARLDTLPAERKSLLQDASVIGNVFWSGAVAFLSGSEERVVREDLHELTKKELVRPSPTSAVRDQPEYAFWHALVRDVAYAQIPRAQRAARHRGAAAWLASMAGEHLEDLAEILAHHTTSALDLARAAGQTEDLGELEADAARYLRLAAARAMALDVGKAEAHLLRAMDHIPPGHPDRPRVQASLAEAAFQAGRLDEADNWYREAIEGLRALGEIREAADAMVRRALVLEYRGEVGPGRSLLTEAIGLLSALPPGPELARALATSAGGHMVSARYREVIPEADRAIDLAETVGEASAAARAHGFRGYARAIQGDPDGVIELREALASLRALGLGRSTAIVYNNLASCLSHVEGSQAALDVFREGVAFAEERGLGEMAIALRSSMTSVLFELGEWDEVLRLAAEVVEAARRSGSGYDEVWAEADRARVLAYRQGSAARQFCESVLGRARPLENAPPVLQAAIAAGIARMASGDRSGTIELMREALLLTKDDAEVRAGELPTLLRLACVAGAPDLAQELLDGTGDLRLERYRLSVSSAMAVLDETRGNLQSALDAYEEAADAWARWGHAVERAYALLGCGRCLIALGRPDEARERLGAARTAFARFGDGQALAELDALDRAMDMGE